MNSTINFHSFIDIYLNNPPIDATNQNQPTPGLATLNTVDDSSANAQTNTSTAWIKSGTNVPEG